MFELTTTTECELTQFTGRTQKSGRDDVPTVSFRLKINDAKNTILDMLSPTIREVIYAPVEGQEQLPGVEVVMPVLRCREMKTWKSDKVHEGWKLFISRGIAEGGGLQMGSCKLDEFTFDLHDQGFVDCEFRISTADVDEEGAGMLWGRQKRKVFVQLHAPELPAAGATEATGAQIDGTVGHPGAAGQGSLLGDDDAGDDGVGTGDDGLGGFDDDMGRGDTEASSGESEGSESGTEGADGETSGGAEEQPVDPQRGENWPFPKPASNGIDTDEARSQEQRAAEREQAELEAGMAQSIAASSVAPKRSRGRKAGVHAE